MEMPSTFNVGQELYVGMEFDSKDAVKNAVKQYVMKVYQSFKVVESKSNKYVVCCLNKNAVSLPFLYEGNFIQKNRYMESHTMGWTIHMSEYDHDTRSRET